MHLQHFCTCESLVGGAGVVYWMVRGADAGYGLHQGAKGDGPGFRVAQQAGVGLQAG